MDLALSLPTEAATARLGAQLASILEPGDIVALSGPLGAGKTHLARAAIHRLTGVADAPSPTYGLVAAYETPNFVLWHFDLFRLESAEEIWELGYEEALDGGVLLIEWPERISALIPEAALIIGLSMEGEGRKARFAADDRWRKRLEFLNRA